VAPPPEPEVAEVRNETASETKEQKIEPIPPAALAVPLLEPPVIREPVPPRDLGRGGEQHRSIQQRLQSEAHKLGFAAPVEKQLARNSTEAADLVLRKGNVALAVEICVTTTTDHEFRNVKKCLAAGFTRIAVVSARPKALKDIGAAVQSGLGPEEAAKVSYFSPDELIAELKKLAAQSETQAAPAAPKERRTRGYIVHRSGPSLSAEEYKIREGIAVRVADDALGDAKSRKKPDGDTPNPS
jgi:hypothetical protein